MSQCGQKVTKWSEKQKQKTGNDTSWNINVEQSCRQAQDLQPNPKIKLQTGGVFKLDSVN